MRHFLFIVMWLFTVGLGAQSEQIQTAPLTSAQSGKFSNLVNQFSVTATLGTGNYHDQFSQLKALSLGELSIQYKTSSRVSFGLGTLGSLTCEEIILDAEGNPVENDDDGDEDTDEPDDDMDEDPDEDCDDFGIGENLMGIFTYRLSDKVPFFISAAAGYSFNGKSPAYSIVAGYNQKIIAGLGLRAGIRYGDIVTTGSTPNFASPTGGLKAELGLSWNF